MFIIYRHMPDNSRVLLERANNGAHAFFFPVFTSGPKTSYLRLANGDLVSGQGASTFSITVVGSPSGLAYGAAQIVVPLEASPQYSINEILTLAGTGPLTGNDTAYSL